MKQQYDLCFYLMLTAAVFVWSAIHPYDRLTWWLEVAPVLMALPILLLTYRRFTLSHFLYALITLHALVLMMGAHYTYARVPLGFWIQDFFDLSRNPYDKLGHFMQGLVPFLVAREISVRLRWIATLTITNFFSLCVAMTISSVYELIEWWGALWLGQGADEFLGTQGYLWDTQSDMFLALLGAAFGWLCFSHYHAASIARLKIK